APAGEASQEPIASSMEEARTSPLWRAARSFLRAASFSTTPIPPAGGLALRKRPATRASPIRPPPTTKTAPPSDMRRPYVVARARTHCPDRRRRWCSPRPDGLARVPVELVTAREPRRRVELYQQATRTDSASSSPGAQGAAAADLHVYCLAPRAAAPPRRAAR